MSTHKNIDRLCAAAAVLCLMLTIAFLNGESLGLQPAASAMGYETRLFNTGKVHTIDIIMDDWEGFLETCENEEYAQCAVVIDGEAYKNTGIRAKGNTSLSMVSAMDSDRYSFKLEFDHYEDARTYYGLDKLSLNNVIQDSTYMKDYLTYQMMGAFGVDAPLCSYVYITVNGEDWGLYLAVEGVEDAFLQRNYGKDFGELYKPDSTNMGGGRGNGRAFDMEEFMNAGEDGADGEVPFSPGGFSEGFASGRPPEDFDPSSLPESSSFPTPPEEWDLAGGQDGEGRENGGGPGGFGGGMGSDDVKLRYIDDDPDSYSNIFQNAKTDVSQADQARLISALKALSNSEDLENTLDVEEVLRYFVIHNFVCNGDSYTGSIVHNYYLYEKDGRLSMIPWDYNLAFGTFQGGSAGSMVNAPIDSPVSGGDSRPMVDWIFDSPEYTALYHQYFQEFLETVDIAGMIDQAAELIAPYVEKDPTAFYSREEFERGVETLRSFCRLRAESVSGQLDGSIPSTEEGQSADASALVDASAITLSDMGTMNHGGGPGGESGPGGQGGPPEMDWHNGERPALSDLSQNGQDPALPSEERSSAAIESPENEAGPDGDAILRQAPSDLRGENGFPGNAGFPGGNGAFEPPASANETSLALTGISLGILFAGLLFALLYRRRGR